jgi:hypothetical protein
MVWGVLVGRWFGAGAALAGAALTRLIYVAKWVLGLLVLCAGRTCVPNPDISRCSPDDPATV